jgi:hypothetical protein
MRCINNGHVVMALKQRQLRAGVESWTEVGGNEG